MAKDPLLRDAVRAIEAKIETAAAQTAVQQAQAAAGSVTQQLVLGRKSFFLAQL